MGALSMQLRCIDAAREAARLAARGDASAAVTARALAPAGAAVQVRREGDFVAATASATSRLLPGLRIEARSVSVVEPGV
ncbi:TadE family type IV pilus minor pilin [Mycolicibacterium vaccae]|uniref:TadE family type IV pilus minor pilin n=1 Tax=Mycolicibacterium vaccae TaxID=1810 RepID=UPI003CE6B5DC